MAWFRVDDTLPDHPKIQQLATALGIDRTLAIGHVVRLWSWVVRFEPDGDITDHAATVIAGAAGWDSDAEKFLKAMIGCGLVDNGKRRMLHNWMRYAEGYRVALRQRTLRAKHARLSRDCRATVTRQSRTSNVDRTGPDRTGPDRTGQDQTKTSLSSEALDVRVVFDHYRKAGHPQAHPKPRPASREWRAVKARLAEGYSIQDLCDAIDGCHATPHNLGENERHQKYLGLELIMRSGSQVTRFIEAKRGGNGSTPAKRKPIAPIDVCLNDVAERMIREEAEAKKAWEAVKQAKQAAAAAQKKEEPNDEPF
ncbi:MAG: hypothetical protein HY323_03450 [Betaproteobacteria bacterium]|nr:hypothetical protein [Betaproteobacteria bacterium]